MLNAVKNWLLGSNSSHTREAEKAEEAGVPSSFALPENKDMTQKDQHEGRAEKDVHGIGDLEVASIRLNEPRMDIKDEGSTLEEMEEVVRNIVIAPTNDIISVKEVLDPARFIVKFAKANYEITTDDGCYAEENPAVVLQNWLGDAFIEAPENDGSVIFEKYCSVIVYDVQSNLSFEDKYYGDDSDDENSMSGENNQFVREPAYSRGVLLSAPEDNYATVFLYDSGFVKSVSTLEFRALDPAIVDALPPAYGMLMIPGLVPRHPTLDASCASSNYWQAESWSPDTMKDVIAWLTHFEKFVLVRKLNVTTGVFYGDLQGIGDNIVSVSGAEDIFYSNFMAKKKHSFLNADLLKILNVQ